MDSYIADDVQRIRAVIEQHADSIPTLRDQFAIAALPVVATLIHTMATVAGEVRVTSPSGKIDEEAIAESAYALADAMLKARES